MTQVEKLTAEVIGNPDLVARLKSLQTDEDFAKALVQHSHELGMQVSESDIYSKMADDRTLATDLSDEEFESVAGTMLGARLSGGHQSGSNC